MNWIFPENLDMNGFATPLTALIVLIGLWTFRGQITKLIDWIVQFRRVEKTKDGYAMHGAEPLAQAPSTSPQEQKLLDATTMEARNSSQEANLLSARTIGQIAEATEVIEESWVDAYTDKDYAKAVKLMQDEIDKSTEAEPPPNWIRSFQASLIFTLDAKDGIAQFTKLTEQFPGNHEPYVWWASSHRKIAQFDLALQVLDRGLLSVTNKSSILGEKVSTLRQADRIPEAIEFGLTSLKEYPDAEDIYLQLAAIYLESKKLPQAIDILERGLVSTTRNELLRAKLATIFWENKAPELAALHFATLAEQFPKNPTYLAYLGNAYLELGFFDRAMVKYREADKVAEGKEAWITGNIGNMLYARGLHSEGIEYLQRAIQMNPNSEYAHRRVAEAITARDAQKKEIEELFVKVERRNTFPLPTHLQLVPLKEIE